MDRKCLLDKNVSRKEILRIAGAGFALGAGGATLAAGGYAAVRGTEAVDAAATVASVPFYGVNQAGIATPQQEHLHFAALDLVTEDPDDVRDLLRARSDAAARMSRGEPAGSENDLLNEYIQHTGSAVFACPPGARDGGYVGESLFENA